LQLTAEGSWELIYKLDQRWVKNNRDPENIVYVNLSHSLVHFTTFNGP
jgi:hypothetical protein